MALQEFSFYGIDEDADGTIDRVGTDTPVTGNFPLEPGAIAQVLTRQTQYQGLVEGDTGVFQDLADVRQFYLSDVREISVGDEFGDPSGGLFPPDGDGGEPPEPAEPQLIAVEAVSAARDEGDDGTTAYTFNLTRSGDNLSSSPVVDIAIEAGDTDADDWAEGRLPEDISIPFTSGEAERSFSVVGAGDTDVEEDEAFSVVITSVSEGEVDPDADTAGGVMVNDDEEEAPPPEGGDGPVISIAAPGEAISEGDEGTTTFAFTVTRSGEDLSAKSSVDVAFIASETDADDFGGSLPETQTVEFKKNETEKTVEIEVSGDLDLERDEEFGLVLEAPTNGEIGSGTAGAIIYNDDSLEFDNIIEGDDESNLLIGTEDADLILGLGKEDILLGGGEADVLQGGDGEDILFGGEGDDILAGNDDADVLNGGAGIDVLQGGDGEDILIGGEGNDIMSGGDRNDVFQFEGAFGDDIITDYEGGRETLSFVGVEEDDITVTGFQGGVSGVSTFVEVDGDETQGTVILLGVDPEDLSIA